MFSPDISRQYHIRVVGSLRSLANLARETGNLESHSVEKKFIGTHEVPKL